MDNDSMSARAQVIIFSKDRPPQLDLLLRSDARFSPQDCRIVSVLWRATTDAARAGYTTLVKEYPRVAFVEERDFHEDLADLVDADVSLTQFLVDDNIFVRSWSMDDGIVTQLDCDDVASVSLRLSPYTDYCYTLNVAVEVPLMLAGRKWLWPVLEGDWCYPHSVDGNLFRTEDILLCVRNGEYAAPNSLEPALVYGMTRPMMACYGRQKIVNVAANSVQDDAASNRNGGADQGPMNERFNTGGRIALAPFLGTWYRSPHIEAEYEWTTHA